MDLWELCFFSHFYACLDFKSIRSSTSFCRKNDSQFDRKKELQAMMDEKEWYFVSYILDIYYLLNSIIHWIAWTDSKHLQWWSRSFDKGEIFAPNCLNILFIFLYWVQKSRVEKDNNKSQLLLSYHATQLDFTIDCADQVISARI